MLPIGVGGVGRGTRSLVHLPSLQIEEDKARPCVPTAAQNLADGHDTALPVTPRWLVQRVPFHAMAPDVETATQRRATGQLTATPTIPTGPTSGARSRCHALPFQRDTSVPWRKGGSE